MCALFMPLFTRHSEGYQTLMAAGSKCLKGGGNEWMGICYSKCSSSLGVQEID